MENRTGNWDGCWLVRPNDSVLCNLAKPNRNPKRRKSRSEKCNEVQKRTNMHEPSKLSHTASIAIANCHTKLHSLTFSGNARSLCSLCSCVCTICLSAPVQQTSPPPHPKENDLHKLNTTQYFIVVRFYLFFPFSFLRSLSADIFVWWHVFFCMHFSQDNIHNRDL